MMPEPSWPRTCQPHQYVPTCFPKSGTDRSSQPRTQAPARRRIVPHEIGHSHEVSDAHCRVAPCPSRATSTAGSQRFDSSSTRVPRSSMAGTASRSRGSRILRSRRRAPRPRRGRCATGTARRVCSSLQQDVGTIVRRARPDGKAVRSKDRERTDH